MKRFSLILTLCSLWVIPVNAFAQETTTGSVQGHVIDTPTTQLPIEGGRSLALTVLKLKWRSIATVNTK